MHSAPRCCAWKLCDEQPASGEPSPGLRRRDLLIAALAGCLAGGPAALHAAGEAGVRVAVVIGNAAYAGATLPNAANDAKAMSSVLTGMGFEVVLAHDAGKARMDQAIAQAHDLLHGKNGIGLLYYAGHGLQVDWHNYLVPVDAAPQSAADVPRQTVNIQSVMDAFKSAGNRMNIVVLDACRDNPFGASASAKGLAPLDAPPGTFLAYATAPGNVADDGSAAEGNGLYTRFLLQELPRQDARIEDVFKRVRLQVRKASQGRQIPWESTSLEDDFVFATGQKAAAPGALRRDAEFNAEKTEWDRIQDSQRAEDFYAFLQRYPNGRISELAQFRLDQLTRPQVQAMQTVKVLPAGVDRFRLGDSWAFERTDKLAGNSVSRMRGEVTAIDGERVLVNGGKTIFNQMGGVLLNGFGAKDPAVAVAPADLQIGKRWRSAFTNRLPGYPAARNFYEHRVVALEDLVVPAGRYRAFRIESNGESISPGSALKLHNMHWVDPATMTLLRQDVRHSSYIGTQLQVDFTDVLLWRKQVPRS
jgi:uncharacterized caspase-like protein